MNSFLSTKLAASNEKAATDARGSVDPEALKAAKTPGLYQSCPLLLHISAL